jgi:uncharacterized membrane protein YgcG
MKHKFFFRILPISLLLFISTIAVALVPVPAFTSKVIDLSGALSSSQIASLEHSITAFESNKNSKIAILVIPSTKPESIEEYSLRTVEQWQLGRKKINDGVLLLIATEDRALRIEVGYGLEGILTDESCQRIISEIISPELKAKNIYAGINKGILQIMTVINSGSLTINNFHPKISPHQAELNKKVEEFVTFFIFIVIMLVIFLNVKRKKRGSNEGITLGEIFKDNDSFSSGGFGGSSKDDGGTFGGGGSSGKW